MHPPLPDCEGNVAKDEFGGSHAWCDQLIELAGETSLALQLLSNHVLLADDPYIRFSAPPSQEATGIDR